jgi:hypothetical protein
MSSSNNIDLDINSYNFFELLNIYQLSNDHNYENITKIENKLKLIQERFSSDIYEFYLKGAKMILTIYALFEQNYIPNMTDTKNINQYMDKIKQIKNYEKYNSNQIIDVIFEMDMKKNNTSQEGISDLNSVLNTTSRLNTLDSLVHNKTNIVYNSFTNSVAPGDLNSIKRITQLTNLNLNSCFRHNYYASNPCDFQYFIPTEIKNVLSMRLASIEIPNAWYLFSNMKKNNTFKIHICHCNEDYTFVIQVPDGNYDSDTLQNYLNTTYFYEAEKDDALKYIKFSIDPYSFKSMFELTHNHPQGFKYSIEFVESINQNIMNTMGWTLGFRLAKYENITGKLQSEALFDAGGDRYIYMSITDYQYNNNMSNIVGFDKSMLNEDIIAKIPIINGKLSMVIDETQNPLAKSRKYNGPVNLSRLHIKILDKFGKVIDFNNMDYSFTLELEVLYESFNFKNVTG